MAQEIDQNNDDGRTHVHAFATEKWNEMCDEQTEGKNVPKRTSYSDTFIFIETNKRKMTALYIWTLCRRRQPITATAAAAVCWQLLLRNCHTNKIKTKEKIEFHTRKMAVIS